MKLNIVKLWLSNSQLIKKRKPPGGEGQVCRVLTCLGIAQRLSCLQPLSLTWMCLQWDFIRYIVQSFSLNVFSIIHATVLLNSACNYISHLSQTILLKFILSVRRLHSTLSLGAPDVYILYLLVLFWPSILCSQWVKVNANDLLVHLFFFLGCYLCVQTLYLLCVGPVSAELLAAAETNAHREMGKTKGGQRWSLRRSCGRSEEER